MIHGYSKILNIGHRQIREIFDSEVTIEEKLDGSQLSWCVKDGQLYARSKGADIIVDAPEKMFSVGITVLNELKDKFKEGWVYRGEYFQKSKHNSLAYDRIPNYHIMIFDISTDIENEQYIPYDEKKAEAKRLGFEVTPCLHIGKVTDVETLRALLDTVSILGGAKIEGFVIKNYEKFNIDGKTMMGKYVSEAFKEVHKGEWKKSNPNNRDITQILISEYQSAARWNKAIQHLREAGRITDSPKDIGPLIFEIHKDIKEECADEIKEKLYKYYMEKILRGAIAGFPEYYKQKLMESAFEKDIITMGDTNDNN